MKPEIRFVIQDTPMAYSHDGLTEIIRMHKRKNPVFKQHMEAGGMILFVNKAMNRCKLFSEDGNVIGYLRITTGKLTETAINSIAETFGGSLKHSDATKRALKALLKEVKDKPNQRENTKVYA